MVAQLLLTAENELVEVGGYELKWQPTGSEGKRNHQIRVITIWRQLWSIRAARADAIDFYR